MCQCHNPRDTANIFSVTQHFFQFLGVPLVGSADHLINLTYRHRIVPYCTGPTGPLGPLHNIFHVFLFGIAPIFVDTTASGDAAHGDASTPSKSAESQHRERHRLIFNERAFGIDNEGNTLPGRTNASTAKVLTKKDYFDVISLLSNWKSHEEMKDMSAEELRAQQLFKKKHKNKGYKCITRYTLDEQDELPDGTTVRRVRRIEKNRDQGRLVIPQLRVFDAIDEYHRSNGHLGQERTYTAVSAKYYSVTQDLAKIYCETCRQCSEKQPVIAPQKGAKKPILSNAFRDRFQVDLVDMSKKQKRNIYGVMQRWIMTVKDHSTGITHVTSIPRKRPKFVAFELDRLFGFIGYPAIFHTDNGKEFTGKEIIQLLRQINPSIISVTGRPRTPRDQGSVESMNKLIKRVLGDIESEQRADGVTDPNWTALLGRVMSAINNHRSRQADSVTSYQAVFGQDYHQSISCTMAEARQCNTIEQRLKASSDTRLAQVAKECCDLSINSGSDEQNDDGY